MTRHSKAMKTTVALVAVGVLGITSASAIGAAGHPTTIRTGNLALEAEATLTPSALPRHSFVPIDAHLRGSVATVDGSHVPPAKDVNLKIDRHFKIDTAGLPICKASEIQASDPTSALRACGDALLGKGTATAEVEFPEQAPFSATGRLLVFNGPAVGGYSQQLDYAYVNVPAPTALIAVAKFSKGSGPFGYQVSITVPKIAGGSGSFTAIDVRLGRKWTYKGRLHSYLSAECANGHFVDQVEALFGDGSDLTGTVLNSCQTKG